MLFETPSESITYLKRILQIDNQFTSVIYLLGLAYYDLYQYDKAIPEFERALDIYKKWNLKPMWILNYTFLGDAYHKTGQYKKEKKLYKQAEQYFPDAPILIFRQAILALAEGDLKRANGYIEKFRTIAKNIPVSDAVATKNLAWIYSEAGILDKSEEYFRQAISLESENPGILNALAYFLINNDRNVNEGLELVNTALVLSPDNYDYLHAKGWGLYKQGRYQEANDILEKSWNLRMENSIYDHEAFLHLEAAKKAVAE